MSQYATEEFYTDEFGGSLITEGTDKYLKEASEKIDSITYNRIVGIGFDNLTDYQKEKIKMAVCYQAEYIYENGYNDEIKGDVSSYRVLDITVTEKQKSNAEKTGAEKRHMSEQAYELIHKTGLDNSII